MLALASGVGFGLYNIVMKLYSARASAAACVMLIGLVVFLCGLVYVLFQKDPAGQISSAFPVLGLIAISAVIWFVATFLQVVSWSDPKFSLAIGAIVVTVALAITASVGGVLFFDEQFTALQLVGIVLAIAGTILLSM